MSEAIPKSDIANVEGQEEILAEVDFELGQTESSLLMDCLRDNYNEWCKETDGGTEGYWHKPNERQAGAFGNLATAMRGFEDVDSFRCLLKRAPGGGKSFDIVRHAQGLGVSTMRRPDGEPVRTVVVVATDAGAEAMGRDRGRGFSKFAPPHRDYYIPVQAFPRKDRSFDKKARAYVMTAKYLQQMSDEEVDDLWERVAIVQVDEVHKVLGTVSAERIERLSSGRALLGYTATPNYSEKHGVGVGLGLNTIIDDQTFRQAIIEGQSPGMQAILVHTGQVLSIGSRRNRLTDADYADMRHNVDRNSLAVDWVEQFARRGIGGMVRCIRGGVSPAEHAVRMKDMILSRGIVNAATGRPLRVEAVGSFQRRQDNRKVYKALNAGDIDWVTEVDVWSQSLDPDPGRLRAIIDMRMGTSQLEKDQLAGRLNRNDPKTLCFFIELIDTYVLASGEARPRRLATILHTLDEPKLLPGAVVGRRGVYAPRKDSKENIDDELSKPFFIEDLPERLKLATMKLAGQVVAELMVVGDLREAPPADWRPVNDLPIAGIRSSPTVRKVLTSLLIERRFDTRNGDMISPADFILASFIDLDDTASAELCTQKDAALIAQMSYMKFKEYADTLGIRGRLLPSNTKTKKPALHYTLQEIAAIQLLSEVIVPKIDPLTDISISELSNELGWPLVQIHGTLRKMTTSDGKALMYNRQVAGAGMGPVACISHDLADTLRRKLSYRMNEDSRPLAALADKNIFPAYAYEKLIAASGLAHAIKVGRYDKSGVPVDKQLKIPFIGQSEAQHVTTWSKDNPDHPLLTLQRFLITSGATPAQTVGALQRLTNFSPLYDEDAEPAHTRSDDFQSARQYLTDNHDTLRDRGEGATKHLHELFATNANAVLPARLILKWLGTTPGLVLHHAPAEKNTKPLKYLEDIFASYVASLVRPLLKGDTI